MKVLVVAACPFPCARGTPVRVYRLSEALVQRGHHVVVATYPLGDQNGPLPFPVERIRALPWYRKLSPGPSPSKLLLLDPMLVFRVATLLRQQRWDVIHAHHVEGLLVALGARRLARVRTPIVYDAHTWVGEELGSYGGRLGPVLASVGDWFDRVPAAHADHMVAVTDDLRQRFLDQGRLAGHRVTVVVNGIEAPFLERVARAVTRQGPRNPAAPRLVYAGNLAVFQGIDALLAAFSRLHRRRPEVELHLLTNGDFSAFREVSERLGILPAIRVRAVTLEDLPAELVAADVLVNPRMQCSGIPQKLLNYMASGRPIVSFAGSAKLVEDGLTARVVEDGDVEAFAAAIGSLLDHPDVAERLGEAAQDLLKREYGWPTAARTMESIYARIQTPEPG